MIRKLAAAAAAVFCAALLSPTGAHAHSLSVPADPNAHGFIGLCDRDNNNVTSGSIGSAPFIWKAVASTPGPAAVQGRGQNTVLNIYQPRPGVAPGDWSGDQLTGASFYSVPNAPAAQATLKDIPLSVVVNEFPPLVNGLYELRMYFGKLNQQLYSQTYPATFIKVVGNTWSVVSGGTVNCAAAGAQSAEVLTGVLSERQAYGGALPSPHGKPTAKASSAAASSSKNGPSTNAGRSSAAGSSPVNASKSSSSTSVAIWILIALVVLGAGGGFVYWWRGRPLPRSR